MQDKIDFLRRAKVDLKVCTNTLKNWSDEVEVDIAAYHLQQALEKTMKHQMTLLGHETPRTHEIKRLWSQLDKLSHTPPEWIWQNHKLLTDFAEKTRYGESLIATQREIEEFIPLLKEYIETVENDSKESDEDNHFKPSNMFS